MKYLICLLVLASACFGQNAQCSQFAAALDGLLIDVSVPIDSVVALLKNKGFKADTIDETIYTNTPSYNLEVQINKYASGVTQSIMIAEQTADSLHRTLSTQLSNQYGIARVVPVTVDGKPAIKRLWDVPCGDKMKVMFGLVLRRGKLSSILEYSLSVFYH